MHEIICLHCHTAFDIDEADDTDIQKQLHDKEFDRHLHERLDMAEQDQRSAV